MLSGRLSLLFLPLFSAAIAECPDGWTASKTVPRKCYLIGNNATDQIPYATEWCTKQQPGSTLITIRNGFENTEIAQLIEATENVSIIWIGLQWNEKDNGSWEWINGENFSYANWLEGEPYPGWTYAAEMAGIPPESNYGFWATAPTPTYIPWPTWWPMPTSNFAYMPACQFYY